MIAWRCVGCTENGRVEGAGAGAAVAMQGCTNLVVGLKVGLALGVLVMLGAGLQCEPPALRDETLACMVEVLKCSDGLQVLKMPPRHQLVAEEGSVVCREQSCGKKYACKKGRKAVTV
jgi:hypothetical protein